MRVPDGSQAAMRQATIRAHQSRPTPMNDGRQLSGAAPGGCAMAALLYSPFMASTAASIPTGFRRIFAWPRVRFTLIVSAVFGLLMGVHAGGVPVFVTRAVMVGSVILLIFGALEQWPRRLP